MALVYQVQLLVENFYHAIPATNFPNFLCFPLNSRFGIHAIEYFQPIVTTSLLIFESALLDSLPHFIGHGYFALVPAGQTPLTRPTAVGSTASVRTLRRLGPSSTSLIPALLTWPPPYPGSSESDSLSLPHVGNSEKLVPAVGSPPLWSLTCDSAPQSDTTSWANHADL